ncbi:SMC-Scp complex subunit ScpB [Legionella sp. W05-934-2]|jgi:segregation and condensation protein B|uniref:SMC-Scp complex subunit ScpB n=1 Tax=Legionella sp. W05-934-2 TaxID=1198649 RepID=UPI0034622240
MIEIDIKAVIEAILITASQPVSEETLLTILQNNGSISPEQITLALHQLKRDYSDRAFELVKLASGWQILTKEAFAPWINLFRAEKPPKYSAATLETLAIIAYKQPVTRGDIEAIRGVSVSSQILKTLVDREWIRISGYRDAPGKPALYRTTSQFLDYFKLPSLQDLPVIEGINGIVEADQIEEIYL